MRQGLPPLPFLSGGQSPKQASEDLQSIIHGMLQFKEEDRLSVEEVKNLIHLHFHPPTASCLQKFFGFLCCCFSCPCLVPSKNIILPKKSKKSIEFKEGVKQPLIDVSEPNN